MNERLGFLKKGWRTKSSGVWAKAAVVELREQ